MPQYLMSVLTDTGTTGTEEEMVAVGLFNEQMMADGNWVFAGGLASPAAATVVDARGGDPLLTDGPFAETKEYIAGLWIVQAPDLPAAQRLAALGSKACNRRVELRPFLELE